MTKRNQVTYDETDTCWHLMVTTYGGTVSMLQNLDAPTASQAYRKLLPQTRPEKAINMPSRGYSCGDGYLINDSTVRNVAIIGPEGADLDPWRGVKAVVIDYSGQYPRQVQA